MSDFPANSVEKSGYAIEFNDDFSAPDLDASSWFPFYLPHWSSRKLAAARYSIANSTLRLHIEADQPQWCPEFDGALRVSSLQTGCFAGTLGSAIGQHRFRPQLIVREEQPTVANYTPLYGYIETRLKAVAIPGYMVALWMIGIEQNPSQSAEICICEIFGAEVNSSLANIGYGLHPFGDRQIRDEFYKDTIGIDAQRFHVYAVDRRHGRVDFYLDNRMLRRVKQSPDYPMQLMLGIYEIPAQLSDASLQTSWPKTLEVDYVRGYRLADNSS